MLLNGLQPLSQQIGQLHVIEVLHQEMGIAMNTLFRQLHQRGMTTMPIERLHEFTGHLQTHPPVLIA